ncbi:hypothetical protein [Shewanella sp.]
MCVYLKQIDLVIKAVEVSSTDDEKDTALALIALIIQQSKSD